MQLHTDFDASVKMYGHIMRAKKNEQNALKNNKKTQAKGYREEVALWVEALTLHLQENLCRKTPGIACPGILGYHVHQMVEKIGDEYKQWPADQVGAKFLEEIEKIVTADYQPK